MKGQRERNSGVKKGFSERGLPMISTATTLTVLVGLFLLGIKWTIDLIRGWPRKRPLSSYFEQQHSIARPADSQVATQTLSHFSRIREEWRRRKVA